MNRREFVLGGLALIPLAFWHKDSSEEKQVADKEIFIDLSAGKDQTVSFLGIRIDGEDKYIPLHRCC